MIRQQANVPTSEVTAAILAGGVSRRFGSDKALAQLPGSAETFIGRAIDTARGVADRVIIVAPERPAYRTLGAELIPDRFPDAGPGGGLVTALAASKSKYLVVMSCDQPLLTPQDLAALLIECQRWPAAAYRGADGGWQPLPCALRVDQCRDAATTAFEEGVGSLASLLARCGAQHIELADSGGGADRLLDVDSVADLRRLSERSDTSPE